MKVFLKVNFKFLLSCLLLLLVFIGISCLDFRINTTASMPKVIYRTSEGQLSRGTDVELCLDGENAKLALEREYLKPGRCEAGVIPLVKAIVGLPGDKITISQNGIAVNDQLRPLSAIRPLDSKGRPMISRLQTGLIPEGKALVLSEHEGGFDGRYFGLVDLKNLKKVEPVLIFEQSGVSSRALQE